MFAAQCKIPEPVRVKESCTDETFAALSMLPGPVRAKESCNDKSTVANEEEVDEVAQGLVHVQVQREVV